MKITSDMKAEITDSSQGKYIAITKKGNTLTVNRTAKKPRGGAKATLEKIQKILEVTDVDVQLKSSLGKISAEIDKGYAKKNDKKFLYKIHSKKVHKVADRIAALTTTPEVPADVFSVLGSFADAQTLGRLAQVNKAAGTAAGTDWTRRAKALGWTGDADPRAFCKGVTDALERMHLLTLANQLISNPEMRLNLDNINNIANFLLISPPSERFEPLMYMLIKKTIKVKGPALFDPSYLFIHPAWTLKDQSGDFYGRINNPNSARTLRAYAAFLAHIGVHYPDLTWFAAADIDQENAKAILDLFPAADLNYRKRKQGFSISPFSEAILKGNLGWVKALIDKGVNINLPLIVWNSEPVQTSPLFSAVKSKNSEMIALLVKAGAKISKTEYFMHYLIQNNPSDQVLLILDSLSKEKFDPYPLMNNTTFVKTPLKMAIMVNHSKEVLEKLVEMGAEINPADQGDSPLRYAQKHKKTKAVAWLKDQGAVIPKKQK